MRFLSAIEWPLRAAILITIPVTIIVATLTYGGRALESIEHSFFDWRTALMATRLSGPHPGVAVVQIGEASIADRACRSPVDRELLAGLIRKIDAAQPRVIAIDYFFDQFSNPAADDALKTALNEAKSPIVLAAYDGRFNSTPLQRYRQAEILAGFGKPVGYANIPREIDGRVRTPAEPEQETVFPISFPQQIIKAAGISDPPLPRRIAWLTPPASGDTFVMLKADGLIGSMSPGPDPADSLLQGRVVLIGPDLFDQSDSYLTPLSTVRADNYHLMPGVLVNAHMVAQLLDGRDYLPLGKHFGFGLGILSAFIGVLYGWYFQDWRGPVNLPPILLFFAADMIVFSVFRIIIPFVIPATAWILGAWIGKWLVKEAGHEATIA